MRDNLVQSFIYFIDFLNIMLIARIILSWFPIGDNVLTRFLIFITEPILSPIRSMLKKSILSSNGLGIDFTPLFALVILEGIGSILKFIVV